MHLCYIMCGHLIQVLLMNSTGRPVPATTFSPYKITHFRDEGAHSFTWRVSDELSNGDYYFKAWSAGLVAYSQAIYVDRPLPGARRRRRLFG